MMPAPVDDRRSDGADLPRLLEQLLEATIAVQGADSGTMLLRDGSSQGLRLVAQQGLSDGFRDRLVTHAADEGTAWMRALRTGEPVIVEDVEQDPDFGSYRDVVATEGVRAVHSTPILGCDRRAVAVVSTHFRRPHRPSERELRVIDLHMRLTSALIADHDEMVALRTARDLARRASAAQSRFLAIASHDLRQPLQAVSLLAGALARTSRDERVREIVQQQQQTLASASQLLNALLDLARLQSGEVEPEFEAFALGEVLAEMVPALAAQAQAKGVRLQQSVAPLHVFSDRAWLRRILQNLLANAVRFTPAGGCVVLAAADHGATVLIEVRDTGVGMSAEELAHAFDEFYQAPAAARDGQGWGLGLSIVGQAAQRLGHQVEVQSEPGQGTTFGLRVATGRR